MRETVAKGNVEAKTEKMPDQKIEDVRRVGNILAVIGTRGWGYWKEDRVANP
jgi:hypothetical protein